MSSWSPPAYLKSNATTKGTRGTLIQSAGAYQYASFGDWWVRSLAAYADAGVVPDYISIQNEPDFFNAGWETCQFDAVESATNAGYGRALDAVSAAIQGSTLATKPALVGPETTGINNNATGRYLANIDAAGADFAVVAHHLYNGGASGMDPAPDSFATSMANVVTAAAGKPIFMTEFAPAAPSMFNTAWMIHDALTTEGVSAYIYWGLIWAPPATATAAPAGLITIQGAASTSPYTINDTYYAMKHFAKWTDPDWTRVGASASLPAVKASAFVSPDGASLTVVLLNTDTTAHVVAVDRGGFAFGTASAYRTSDGSAGDGAAGTAPATTERAAAIAFDPATTFALPARAIATLVLAP
jgi:glucuronoarabinoxylan endo-1,4-beta-xylanase